MGSLSWLAIGVDAGKELVGAVFTGAILAVWKKYGALSTRC